MDKVEHIIPLVDFDEYDAAEGSDLLCKSDGEEPDIDYVALEIVKAQVILDAIQRARQRERRHQRQQTEADSN